MKSHYDAAVVGGGPAGLICATELRSLGGDVVVIERDKTIGEPVQCAGLFNLDGLERLGIQKGDFVLNEVKGARFYGGDGVAKIRAKKSKACVVDRAAFDRHLAQCYGGELAAGRAVETIKRAGKGFELEGAGFETSASRVVLATGCGQGLHRAVGLDAPGAFIFTSQQEMVGVNVDTDLVEIYAGPVAPGFFAWVIPIGKTRARVGLGTLGPENSVQRLFAAFVNRLKDDGKLGPDSRTVSSSGGPIPLYEPGLRIENNGAYSVGDAASQVKATTGGGVMLGGLAAKILARSIHNGESYAKNLEALERELSNHLLIRKVLNRFGDTEYGHMAEFLNRPDVKQAVEEHGDMDIVSPLLKIVMGDPAMLEQAMRMFDRALA